MSRSMSPEREAEFDRLARFLKLAFSLMFQKLPSKSENEHPYNALMAGVEKDGKSKHMTGLKQAVNDVLAMTAELPNEALKTLDNMLAEAKSATVTEMRREYWSKVKTIRKRGKIKNDTEYYLIKDLADDDSELIGLLEDYEFGDS